MKKKFRAVLLFFAVVTLLFSLISYHTAWDAVPVRTERGLADLTRLDLDAEIAQVRPEGFLYYPDALLVPSDFSDGAPPGRTFTDADKSRVQYGTYRVTLRLPPGRTYALRSMAVNFSQRIFINGEEHAAVGRPGTSAADTVPAARTALYLFTPEADETEIVLQYANFVYRGGGEAYPLYVSRYDNLVRGEQLALFRVCMAVGGMLTIFIFYCGIFLFFQRKGYFLAFGVSCLAIALHTLLVGDKFITRLWPALGWYAAMRMEYLALIVMIAAFVLYLYWVFPGLLHRKGFRCYMGFSGLFAAVVLLTPPRIFSWGLLVYQAVSVPYGLYIIWRLARKLRRVREVEALLAMTGGGVFLVGVIAESFLFSRSVQVGVTGFEQPAMMVFIFANTVALVVHYARTEELLTQEKEVNRLKTDFLNRASHDLKTPVTTMGLAIQRLEAIEDEGQRKRFLSALERSQQDMARLVGNLLNTVRLDDGGLTYNLKPFAADQLCRAVQVKYEDTLELAGVSLDVAAETDERFWADAALLWSVLDNLVYNALRYTPRGGSIQVTAGRTPEGVRLEVADTGPGIPAEALPRIFDRGYSAGDQGGSGMGLYIVKTAMTGMGGGVTAANGPAGGAVFTLCFRACP